MNTILAVPSITLRATGALDIPTGSTALNFILDKQNNLPPQYQSTGNSFSFAPVIISTGSRCDITTDTGMIDLAKAVKNAYNHAPFTSISDYSTLLSASSDTDFAQIGYSYLTNDLGCKNIPQPTIQNIATVVTLPITPLSCTGEDLDFESYTTGSLPASSCLFTETGTATGWLITNTAASHGVQSIRSPLAF